VARSVTTSAATALPAEDARDGGRGRGDHHRATSDENASNNSPYFVTSAFLGDYLATLGKPELLGAALG
jgi:hypothetical protein